VIRKPGRRSELPGKRSGERVDGQNGRWIIRRIGRWSGLPGKSFSSPSGQSESLGSGHLPEVLNQVSRQVSALVR
jgi:hypothetical protein